MEYFIVQYFYWSDGCRINHSFETFDTEFYQLSEVKAEADRIVKHNRDCIHGYYITKQEILESNM